MRGMMLFVAGIVVGLAAQTAIAQNQNRGIVGLNRDESLRRTRGEHGRSHRDVQAAGSKRD